MTFPLYISCSIYLLYLIALYFFLIEFWVISSDLNLNSVLFSAALLYSIFLLYSFLFFKCNSIILNLILFRFFCFVLFFIKLSYSFFMLILGWTSGICCLCSCVEVWTVLLTGLALRITKETTSESSTGWNNA